MSRVSMTPPTGVASDGESRLDLRALLEAERDQLLEQAGMSADDLVDTEDPGAAHDAVTAALEAMARTGLDHVTSALARLDAGTFGACLDCGTGIPVERLEIMPSARFCVDCQQRNE